MYLRLVQARTKLEEVSNLQALYTNTIIPTLHGIPGCLYACLMQSNKNPEDMVSMTLWESEEDAEEYVKYIGMAGATLKGNQGGVFPVTAGARDFDVPCHFGSTDKADGWLTGKEPVPQAGLGESETRHETRVQSPLCQ